jgi:hypothetical protein
VTRLVLLGTPGGFLLGQQDGAGDPATEWTLRYPALVSFPAVPLQSQLTGGFGGFLSQPILVALPTPHLHVPPQHVWTAEVLGESTLNGAGYPPMAELVKAYRALVQQHTGPAPRVVA